MAERMDSGGEELSWQMREGAEAVARHAAVQRARSGTLYSQRGLPHARRLFSRARNFSASAGARKMPRDALKQWFSRALLFCSFFFRERLVLSRLRCHVT